MTGHGEDPHPRRASSFGAVAAAYAEHRPGYPDEAVAWVMAPSPGLRALDLGAGTGKLTEVLVRRGTGVVAVEPDDRMRAELAARLPGVTALAGAADRIPLGDRSVDAVLVGQAFHWFDPDTALPEIVRVLRPGGVLAVMGNAEDETVEWVRGLLDASREARPDQLGTTGRGFADVPGHPALAAPKRAEFRWSWPRTIDSLIATISTHSWVLLSEPEQQDAGLAALRRYLEEHPATCSGGFELPMVTRVVRMRRTAG